MGNGAAGGDAGASVPELLAQRLRDAGRGPDDRLSVAELRRSLLPYPLCREVLELASKAEYDVALLRLLRADDLLESDDPELDEDVERELGSPEPGLGVLDDHAAVGLRPGPRLAEALRGVRARGEDGEARPGAGDRGDGPTGAGDAAGSRVVSRAAEGKAGAAGGAGGGPAPAVEDERGAGAGSSGDGPTVAACPSCGGEVPDVVGVRFCPGCGAPLDAARCRACGEELRAGWRHCPFCGSERHD